MGNWSPEQGIGTISATSGRPGLAVFDNKLYCIYEGLGTGSLMCTSFDGTYWASSEQIPNWASGFGASGPPGLAVYDKLLFCVHEGRNNSGWVWCATFNGTDWSLDGLIPSGGNAYGTSGTPALAVFQNRIYCVRQGRSNSENLWYAYYDGSAWSNDQVIPGSSGLSGTSAPPALAVFNNKLYCIYQGAGNSGLLWYTVFDGANWSPCEMIPDPNTPFGLSGSPALAVFNNMLYCAHQGIGNSGQLHCVTFDGTNWSLDELIPATGNAYGISGSPSLAVFNGKLYCIYEGAGNSGYLMYSTLG